MDRREDDMDAVKRLGGVLLLGLIGLVLVLIDNPSVGTLVAGLIGITAAVLLVAMVDSLLRLRRQ